MAAASGRRRAAGAARAPIAGGESSESESVHGLVSTKSALGAPCVRVKRIFVEATSKRFEEIGGQACDICLKTAAIPS